MDGLPFLDFDPIFAGLRRGHHRDRHHRDSCFAKGRPLTGDGSQRPGGVRGRRAGFLGTDFAQKIVEPRTNREGFLAHEPGGTGNFGDRHENEAVDDLSQIDQAISAEMETLDRSRLAQSRDQRPHGSARPGHQRGNHLDGHIRFRRDPGNKRATAIHDQSRLQARIFGELAQQVIRPRCRLLVDLEGDGGGVVSLSGRLGLSPVHGIKNRLKAGSSRNTIRNQAAGTSIGLAFDLGTLSVSLTSKLFLQRFDAAREA